MVIYQEISGTDLVCAYSNNKMMIRQDKMMIRQDETGNLYSEAIDPVYMNRTYTETDIPIEEELSVMEPQEALDFIFGGQEGE